MEFVYIGIKTKDSPDGMSKIHGSTKLFAPVDMNARMVKDIPLFKGLFNGMYNKVIMLHDPSLPATPLKKEEKKAKGLSPTHKAKVKEMIEEGKGTIQIAEALNVSTERIEAYLGL